MPARATLNDEVYIYGLIDPETGEVRYVGCSTDPVARLKGHRTEASWGMTQKCIWIRELSRRKLAPTVTVLEAVTSATWRDREQFWIERLRAEGAALTNGIAGSRRPETRREFYTVDEVAARFGISVRQVRADLNQRTIVGERRVNGIVIFGASLETYEPVSSEVNTVRPSKPRPPRMAERLAALEARVAELESLLEAARPEGEEAR